jgi:anti-sigma factor RsiW
VKTVGEQTLFAFADGELGPLRRDEVEQALAEDPELRARLERDRRLRAFLSAHYDAVADEPVPPRLEALVLGGGASRSGRRRRVLVQAAAGLAAAFVIAWIVAGAL